MSTWLVNYSVRTPVTEFGPHVEPLVQVAGLHCHLAAEEENTVVFHTTSKLSALFLKTIIGSTVPVPC